MDTKGVGLPARWDVDKLGEIDCPAFNIPKFLGKHKFRTNIILVFLRKSVFKNFT